MSLTLDPLQLPSGQAVTAARTWQAEQAPRLRQLFQEHVYGRWPPAGRARYRSLHTPETVLDGTATASETEVEVELEGGAVRFAVLVVRPRSASRPPCLLGLNRLGNADVLANLSAAPTVRSGRPPGWPVAELVRRGYAVATFAVAQLVPDQAEAAEAALARFRADRSARRGPGDTGALAAWAWGLSQTVELLGTWGDVDAGRLAVVGHSRYGKAALLAGAMDDRLAAVAPAGSGCGGAALWRGPLHGEPGRAVETLERVVDTFSYWFCPRLADYRGRVAELPVDQHQLFALCAPRPVLVSNGETDWWVWPEGQRWALQAAAPVYRLFEPAEQLGPPSRPRPSVLYSGRLGWWSRPGTHAMTADDWQANLDYLDTWLR